MTESSLNNQLVSAGIGQYLINLLILSLLTGIVYLYDIEEGLGLFRLMCLVTSGYAIHALLPFNLQGGFLMILNLLGLFLFFNPWVSLGVILAGLILLAIADTPLHPTVKTAALGGIGILLAIGTVWDHLPPSIRQVSSVVGVLFMFRMILYLHERRVKKVDANYWQRLSYFFMLPNYAFFIFPIVDYRTYISRYNASTQVHLKGVTWMSIGILQLILYRIVYYYLLPAPSEVQSIWDLFEYSVYSYLMILRLLGVFELSVGILCIFGFDLPRIFRNIFLADGFIDVWRRINIYYRDFVTKIIYYPVYFRFREVFRSPIVITVLVVFFFNWFFHAYQWFWIVRDFPLKVTDIAFWSILGVLVAGNSWLHSKKINRSSHANTGKSSLMRSIRIVVMFLTMCFLWVLWTSETVDEFYGLLMVSGQNLANEIMWILMVVGLGITLLTFLFQWDSRTGLISDMDGISIAKRNFLLMTLIFLGMLGLANASDWIRDKTSIDLGGVFESRLNAYDSEKQFKGYYETLVASTSLSSRLWEGVQHEIDVEEKHSLKSVGLLRDRVSLLDKQLVPNADTIFKGKPISTNEHGLRDRRNYYPRVKERGVLRIALLGGSIEFGPGVHNHETFENLLEDKINTNRLWPEWKRIEIMNFAISGTHWPNHLYRMENVVSEFNPDMVIYTAHKGELYRSLTVLIKLMHSYEVSHYPYLADIAVKAGLNKTMTELESIKLLMPYCSEMYRWGLERIYRQFASDSGIYQWIYLGYSERKNNVEFDELSPLVNEIGYSTYNLAGIFGVYNKNDVSLSSSDNHPSALGHQIIADSLFQQLADDQQLAFRLRQRYQRKFGNQ